MADITEELRRTVAEQEKQIRTLKQAVMRLEVKLSQVSAIARRAQEISRTNRERWQSIQHRMGKS